MRENPLSLDTRRILFDHISKNPGVHLRKISRNLNMDLNTVRFHITYLEKSGLITSNIDMNRKIFFVANLFNLKDKKISGVLQQKRFRDIIILLLLRPGITHATISGKLSIKLSTLSKYLKHLEELKIITSHRDGRKKNYFVREKDNIVKLLITYKKSFWDSIIDNALEIFFD